MQKRHEYGTVYKSRDYFDIYSQLWNWLCEKPRFFGLWSADRVQSHFKHQKFRIKSNQPKNKSVSCEVHMLNSLSKDRFLIAWKSLREPWLSSFHSIKFYKSVFEYKSGLNIFYERMKDLP